MKITKQRLKEIIREELEAASPGYEVLGKRRLRWAGSKDKWPSAASAKRVFQDVAQEMQTDLSREERLRAMQWIDGSWEQMPNRATAKEAIQQWLEDRV